MKRFLKTLHGKISVIFVAFLLVVGAAQIGISVQSSLNFVCETDQIINRFLAKNLARRLQQYLKNEIDSIPLEREISEVLELNPRIEIYFTDSDGNIKIHFSNPEKIEINQIDVIAVKEFINYTADKNFPIMGVDPKAENRRKVFSAADIILEDAPGYIYIILGSELYDNAMIGVGESYILRSTAIIFFIMIVLASGLGSGLFFNLTRRLRKMTKLVQEFEKGKYKTRIKVKSDDEVGQLTTAFNLMALKIENSMRELNENDALRRELIANISHDLRSPLTSIQGYIETILIKDEKIDPERRQALLETVLRNVKNLNQLVSELFELSKLDAMTQKVIFEPFSIAELSQDIVLKFTPQAEKRGITLLTKIPANLPFVIGDIALMDRVLSNLIDNAIRYAHPKTRVTIYIEPIDDRINIRVSNYGDIIPKKDLLFIFDRFYRVEKSRSKDSGGSGLGLAIVKKIVEAHESEIFVSSDSQKGTEFSFNLSSI